MNKPRTLLIVGAALCVGFIGGCRYGMPTNHVRLKTGQVFPITYHSKNYATVGTLRQNIEAILDAPPEEVKYKIEHIINTNRRAGVYGND